MITGGGVPSNRTLVQSIRPMPTTPRGLLPGGVQEQDAPHFLHRERVALHRVAAPAPLGNRRGRHRGAALTKAERTVSLGSALQSPMARSIISPSTRSSHVV